jgi:hypothetical protein
MVPNNVCEAYDLYKQNCNTNWKDAMQEEIDSLPAYSTFYKEGHITYFHGYNNIDVHFAFAVKHDLRYKAGLVPGGHFTDPNTTDSKYSSNVSLRSIRIAIAACEFNGLSLMIGDISSSYLESFTHKKVCFIACTEF